MENQPMPDSARQLLLYILMLVLPTGVTADNNPQADNLHQAFDQVLKAAVDDGHVNYTLIKKDPRFKSYLQALKQARPENFNGEAEQLAFWINAYNALAIKGIIDGLSPSSFIGRISYFKTTEFEVAGREINLYDLERDIIIPFSEPRIHFAIVCASFSCPKLRPEAYTASKLEQQLQENTLDFLNDPTKNNFDLKKKRANLSKIFDWFKKDFKKHSGTVQKYVANYVNDPELREALMTEKFRIKHLKYQWTLNGSLE